MKITVIENEFTKKYNIDFTPSKKDVLDSAYDCRAYLHNEVNKPIDKLIIYPIFDNETYNNEFINPTLNRIYKINLGFSIDNLNYKGEIDITNTNIPITSKTILDCVLSSQLRSRSGLASKGIETVHGTIDTKYNNSICALVKNYSNEPFTLNFGDRICQLFFETSLIIPNINNYVQKVNTLELLNGDMRGGFGSTGIK